MAVEIQCEGAPRDLGLDQGRACRDELRAWFERSPWWRRGLRQLGVDGSRVARLSRDLARHFPQQSEAIEGLARGAGVPTGWFAEMLSREIAGEEDPTRAGGAVALAAGPALTTGGCLVARTLARSSVVRRSAPEGGFASVEVTRPWLTAALAGVNEGGLAAASASLPGALTADSCSVPAALLVQDCLARFDCIDGAVDWCTGRPAGGRAVILLADAAGGILAVEIDGNARRVVQPKDGLVLEGGAFGFAGAIRAAAPLDAGASAKILGSRIAGLDPAGRRIALIDPATASARWFAVRRDRQPQAPEGRAQRGAAGRSGVARALPGPGPQG